MANEKKELRDLKARVDDLTQRVEALEGGPVTPPPPSPDSSQSA